jgi:PAS domain S-box-containing protein
MPVAPERLLDLFDSLGYLVATYDREGRCTYANAAAAAADHRAPDTLREVLASGRTERGVRFDSTAKRWFEEHVHPVAEGVLVLARDVTLERDVEVRHQRDVMSLAMRAGAMGAWSRDFATDDVWWSPELEDIVGLERGTFARTEPAFFAIVHEEDLPRVQQAVGGAVVSGTDYIVDFRFRHASGEWRWMEGRGRAVYDEDGQPRSIYGIGIDVTARKRAEAAVEAAKEAAESANRLKDQFLANLSHELRTPLNAILGYARLLQTGAIPAEKLRQAIAVIERNAIAQNQLVEDLLDMSRITTGAVHLDPAPIPIASIIRQALDVITPTAETKRIEVVVDLDPFAGMVNADATRLQQVFWNLLNNAVKFTPQSGRIAVTLARRGHAVEVAITDSGIGIAPAFLPHVFVPFRQADARFGRRFGGLGLGLAICKQLVELHGGTIEASSAGEGCGATFLVRLPSQRAAEGDEPKAPRGTPLPEPASRGALAGVRVLLVDDEADTLTLFQTIFEDHGAIVRPAASARDALLTLPEWRPDLLVTDLGLPGVDGYELLRAVREKPALRELPAVAVTAYARPEDRERVLQAGFQAYVSKPVDPEQLVRALAGAVNRSSASAGR